MIAYCFALFFIIIAFLPLTRGTHWLIRCWDFARVQTSFLQVLTLILLLIFAFPVETWEWGVTIILIATIIFQASLVFPYSQYFPIKRQKPDSFDNLRKIRLITSNVLQTNSDYTKLIEQVNEHAPDLLLTMETNNDWEKALEPIEKDFPYKVCVPLENFYGMHLYSKFELSDTQINYLVEKDVPSIFTKVHYRKGAPLNLICVHPAPPSPTENETSEERDAELLIVGKAVRELNNPIIVCGDLNDVVWSRISRLFTKMTALKDPRIGRGLFPTFHADYWYSRFPIDHLFHSNDITVDAMKRLPHIGSDHFPMFFTLWVENGAEESETPDLDKVTEEEIEERIEEGLEHRTE
tara:strand:- start:537 stop:1592 length:1056 start_codon:yes stop_codon:yes gene_type:complete